MKLGRNSPASVFTGEALHLVKYNRPPQVLEFCPNAPQSSQSSTGSYYPHSTSSSPRRSSSSSSSSLLPPPLRAGEGDALPFVGWDSNLTAAKAPTAPVESSVSSLGSEVGARHAGGRIPTPSSRNAGKGGSFDEGGHAIQKKRDGITRKENWKWVPPPSAKIRSLSPNRGGRKQGGTATHATMNRVSTWKRHGGREGLSSSLSPGRVSHSGHSSSSVFNR